MSIQKQITDNWPLNEDTYSQTMGKPHLLHSVLDSQ